MNIEEKAKAYDEAIERARKEYKNHEAFKGFCEMLVHIFPELKESENERIRKALIDGFTVMNTVMKESKNCGKTFSNHNIPITDILAWLEKQVPIDEEKVLIGARKDVALSIINFLDRNTFGMCLSNMECKDLEDAVVNSDWSKVYDYMKKKLEMQGEQKSINNQFTPEQASVLDKHIDKFLEQNPADKVKPKFKVGDIV